MPLEERFVELTYPECCALRFAFEHNPKTVEILAQIIPIKRLELFEYILGNTLKMSFSPNEDAAEVYRALAMEELKRLSRIPPNSRLPCLHSCADHVSALKLVIEIMKVSEN